MVLGFDVGGTNTRCVLVDLKPGRFHIAAFWSFETSSARHAFLDAISQAIAEGQKKAGKQKISGIGFGIPGPLSADRTRILEAPNAPQIHHLPLPEIMQKKFHIPVRMENDADAFTLAEARRGAGKGSRRVLGVTLGTGVGGGLVIDELIDRGAHGSAGEIGHMIIAARGRRCSCGGRGHLEEYISHRAFVRDTGNTPKALLVKARGGNAQAIRAFTRFGEMLGLGIASAVNLWDPEIVVVGGGISNAAPYLLPAVRRAAAGNIVSPAARRALKIRRSRFGKYSGALGAALLFEE